MQPVYFWLQRTFERVLDGEGSFVVPGREQPDAVKALPSPFNH